MERAEQSVYLITKYNAIFMAFVTLLFTFFATPIIGFFTREEEVLKYGAEALRIIGSGYVFYGISMVMTSPLNGAGDTKTPTTINFICFWLFQIPFAYFLSIGMDLRSRGALIAVPVAQVFIALLVWYYFYKCKWKEVKV